MEVLISVLGAKSLSHSTLIAKSLYSTLQVGSATHRAARVEADDVPFTINGAVANAALIITLRNGQTQTAMYVRNVPLSVVAGAAKAVDLWVAVYAPGDPRNQSFIDDSSAPRPDMPQVHLCIRRVDSPDPEDFSIDGLRQTRDRLEEELAQTRQRASTLLSNDTAPRFSTLGSDSAASGFSSERSSALDGHEAIAIREAAGQAQDIKSKVTAMASAQRQAQSAEQQLQDVIQEVDEARRRLERVEQDLQRATAEKNQAEREKQEARDACNKARETLRLRDLSILELKGNRDHADRQLAEVMAGREQKRTEMENSLQKFDTEVRGMGTELDRWRAEATSLTEALERCDSRVQGLHEQLNAAQSSGSAGGSAELMALQQQLDEAVADLDDVQAKRDESRQQLAELESGITEVRRQLAERDSQAEDQRQRGKQIRLEASAVERELIVQMGKAAQIEGQVGENKNQLRDLDGRLDDLRKLVDRHQSSRIDLEATVAVLRGEVSNEECEIEAAKERSVAAETKLAHVKKELEECRARSALLETRRHDVDEACAKPAAKAEVQGVGQSMEKLTEMSELEAAGKAAETRLADLTMSYKQITDQIVLAQEEHERQKLVVSQHRSQSGTSLPSSIDMLETQIAATKKRGEDLQAELAEVEASAAQANVLIGECATLEEQLQRQRDRRGEEVAAHDDELARTRRADREASDMLVEHTAELDRRIDRIDELEREVVQLSAQAEALNKIKGKMLDRFGAMGPEPSATKPGDMEHQARCNFLKQDVAEATAQKQRREAEIASLQAQVSGAEDAVVDLEAKLAEYAEDLKRIQARAAAETAQRRVRASAARKEVAAEQDLVTEASANAKLLEAEVRAAKERCESFGRKLQEKQSQVALVRGEINEAEQDQKVADVEQYSPFGPDDEQLKAAQDMEREIERLNTGVAADDRKQILLKEQLAAREEALAKSRVEAHQLEVANEGLKAELDNLRQQMSSLEDRLAYQVDHDKLQCTSIDKLTEEIRSLEGEAEILTVGLHEAEQQNETLYKENYLMRQQMEGLYKGTVQDWAIEVTRMKIVAETERAKDELGHWQKVSEDAERDLSVDVKAAQENHDAIEDGLRRKLEELPEELIRYDQMAQDLSKQMPRAPGSVHAVPASLHGLVSLPKRAAAALTPGKEQRRRVLVVGCNCSKWHAPLSGCANDAWNVQCLMRHSLQYKEDQVRCLIDASASCQSPPRAQPTKANILEGLRWLVSRAGPTDNLCFVYSGYSTRLPVGSADGPVEVCLVPVDLADDLPDGFGSDAAQSLPREGSSYRVITMSEVKSVFQQAPKGCKVTIVLDCGAAWIPGLSAISLGGEGATPLEIHAANDAADPFEALRLPGGVKIKRRSLFLPQLPLPAFQQAVSNNGSSSTQLSCDCYCYSASNGDAQCVELPIEGMMQGAFVWSFVKAMTACHLEGSVQQHSKALNSILTDLRAHFHWLDQMPVLQLSETTTTRDFVLVS